jgi:hypothetical protein
MTRMEECLEDDEGEASFSENPEHNWQVPREWSATRAWRQTHLGM